MTIQPTSILSYNSKDHVQENAKLDQSICPNSQISAGLPADMFQDPCRHSALLVLQAANLPCFSLAIKNIGARQQVLGKFDTLDGDVIVYWTATMSWFSTSCLPFLYTSLNKHYRCTVNLSRGSLSLDNVEEQYHSLETLRRWRSQARLTGKSTLQNHSTTHLVLDQLYSSYTIPQVRSLPPLRF